MTRATLSDEQLEQLRTRSGVAWSIIPWEEHVKLNNQWECLYGDFRRWRRNQQRGNPDGVRSLVKYSKLPGEQIRYVPDADKGTVRSISRGILFLIAFWSRPSVKSFAELTRVVARIGEDIEVVVVDVDGCESIYEQLGFQAVHGCGEAAWVRNGKIVATSGIGMNVDCVEPYTRLLLAMP